jgi:hypothetical protein
VTGGTVIKGTINVSARTFDDFWYALEEAYQRIEGGNTSGQDSNDSGSFDFSLTDNTEESSSP